MVWIVYALIVGVNLAPFFIQKLDLWHAQGVAVQVGALIAFALSFILGPQKEPKNKGLGVVLLWAGLLTAWFCFQTQLKGRYEIALFFPFFNLLCLVIIYKGIVGYLSKRDIERVYKVLWWSVVCTIFLCYLQYFNLSQFFQLLFPGDKWRNNMVVGMVGNGTQLSAFLAMCLPIFFYKLNRENILCIIAALLILFCMTGTIKNDPAMSGVVVAMAVSVYYYFKKDRDIVWILIILFLLFGILVFLFFPELNKNLSNPQGKVALWSFYWKLCKQTFIFGKGIGWVNTIYRFTGVFRENRHVHMEYLQVLLESGLVGLVCVGYFIRDFMRQNAEGLGLVFKSIFIGFLISGCFNYPFHIWIVTTYATIAYGCLIAYNERCKDDCHKEANKGFCPEYYSTT